MDISRSSSSNSHPRTAPKIIYSAPASPAASNSSGAQHQQQRPSALSTPKKHFLDAVMLHALREKLKTTPRSGVGSSAGGNSSGGTNCELQALRLSNGSGYNAPTTLPASLSSSSSPLPLLHVIKDRYLISAQPCQLSAAAAAKTPASYRHLIDLSSSNLRCTDVFTERQYLCKIINEPLHKVQRAYHQLAQSAADCRSTIYGHALIRGVHDIVPLSAQRTYVIIAGASEEEHEDDAAEHMDTSSSAESSGAAPATTPARAGVYEDLHTYIRNKRRLAEPEARALFHQICQTVQVCHRHGIILRDLKLKRFYFIDAARTKLQYESLEGSMILDNAADDTLSDKIGCPLYTAPELLCPQPTYRGKPADMWSLGVILYTMLVGQYPFYEKGNCNLITIIRHCHVQIPQSLSRSVRWLLMALLRKQYAERMSAEHIFHAPWLRTQRSFYACVPADALIADESDDTLDAQLDAVTEAMDEAALSQFCLTTATQQEYACAAPQPLDYTRQALQQQQQRQQDVEMVG